MNKKQLIFVQEYVIHKPNIDVVDDINIDVVRGCGCNYSHSLGKQFVIYDLNFTNIKSNKNDNIISHNIIDG